MAERPRNMFVGFMNLKEFKVWETVSGISTKAINNGVFH